METKANYVLIGAFTLAGFLGILGFLMWFANLELNRQFAYYDVYFPDVSGLSISSDVQFAGLSVGRVIDMQLSSSDSGAVRVRVEMSEDTPVRKDSAASMTAQGVTGVYAVAISAGTPGQPLLRDSSTTDVPVIESSRSMLQSLTDQGPQIIDRLAMVAEQMNELLGEGNQTRVRNILDNVERSSANIDAALADITKTTAAIGSAAEDIAGFGDNLESIGQSAQTTMANADTALQKFTESATKADAVFDSGTAVLDEAKRYMAEDLKGLTTRLETAATTLDTTLTTLDQTMKLGQGTLASAGRAFDGVEQVVANDIAPVTADLRVTLGHLNEAIDKVVADMPEITARLRDAADSAGSAFASLQSTIEALRGPAQAFAREGLPQFTRTASDLRGLVDNANQLVSVLRRNPSQLFSGRQTPEFRR